jgi:hypothetical protein
MASDVHDILKTAFSDEVLSTKITHEWFWKFKGRQKSTESDPCSEKTDY